MNKQLQLPTMRGLRPPHPTIRDESVALAIATRIVKDVNLDYLYWTEDEIEDRISDVQFEIMRAGRPATVFHRLFARKRPINCKGDREVHPYGWEGIDERCRHIADDIADEELRSALAAWARRYGVKP